DFSQATSAWATQRVGIGNFQTEFTFRLHDGTDPRADGFAFVIQADPRGLAGGGLGSGPDQPTGSAANSIVNSIAIKFDLYPNTGDASEGNNSTGIFSNGRSPSIRAPGLPPISRTIPDRSVNLNGTPIQLNNQELKRAILTY